MPGNALAAYNPVHGDECPARRTGDGEIKQDVQAMQCYGLSGTDTQLSIILLLVLKSKHANILGH